MADKPKRPLPRPQHPAGTVINGKKVGGQYLSDAEIAAANPTPPAQQPAATTTPATQQPTQAVNRAPRRRSLQLGRRAAAFVSGSLFGFGAPITRDISRKIRPLRGGGADYQNISAMEGAPSSMEAERVQASEDRATLSRISETLVRIEGTLISILNALGGSRGAAGGAGPQAPGGGLLPNLGDFLRNLLNRAPSLPGRRGGTSRAAPPAGRQRGNRAVRRARVAARRMRQRTQRAARTAGQRIRSSAGRVGEAARGAGRSVAQAGQTAARTIGQSVVRAAPVLGAAAAGAAAIGIGAASLGVIGAGIYGALTMSPEQREEINRRAAEQAEAGRQALTPGQQAGRGVGQGLRAGYYGDQPADLSLETIMDTLETPAPNETPEQRTSRERMANELSRGNGRPTPEVIQYVRSRIAEAQPQPQPQPVQEPPPREPPPVAGEAPPAAPTAVPTAGETLPAPPPVAGETLPAPPPVAGEAPPPEPARAPPTPPAPPAQEPQRAEPTAQQITPENFDLQRYRQLDREGATIFERRVTQRTNEIINEIVERERPRGTVGRNNLVRQRQGEAREQATREVLAEPAIAERINRVMNPQQATPAERVNTPTATNTPTAPTQAPAQPAANIAPAENAENLARTLSESAPGPTVIPIPIPQGGGQVQQGGGGGSAGGGSGATSARAPSAPPPVHPPRPAEYITPQVSGR